VNGRLARGVAVCAALLLVACDKAPRASAPNVAEKPDFTGLWQVADASLTVKPEDDTGLLTEEGLRRKQEYRENFDPQRDDPSNFCLPHGMPWIMVSRARDYLIDIYQTPDRVTLLLEGMDVFRLVRLDQTAVPETYNPGTNGYSLGHWDDDTLVIETTQLRPSNPVGPFQRSAQMRVTERWKLIQHPKYGTALEVRIVAIDPVLYRKPGKAYQLLVPAPPGSTLNAYGCPQSRYDDHIEQIRTKHAKVS
jgi:hypothetical protein